MFYFPLKHDLLPQFWNSLKVSLKVDCAQLGAKKFLIKKKKVHHSFIISKLCILVRVSSFICHIQEAIHCMVIAMKCLEKLQVVVDPEYIPGMHFEWNAGPSLRSN